MTLDKFYPIVESADWVRRLVGVGAKLVQLRVKEASDGDVTAEIEGASLACDDAGAQVIVNVYWQAAIEAGCDFVHLGQGDLDTADVKAIRKAGVKLGVSTHSHDELDRALSYDPDYVALGPIYPTALKEMIWEPQGLDRIGEWKKIVGDRPLVAIGGLTLERALLCLKAGADSAAVVTDIVRAANPEARAREWIAATR